MTLKFVLGGTHGEVSGVPDEVYAQLKEANHNGVGFVDFAYKAPGFSAHSVVGLQVGAVTIAPTTSIVFTGAVSAQINGGGAYLLRGPGDVGRSSWTGEFRSRILSMTTSAVERMFRLPLGRIVVQPVVAEIGAHERIAHLLAALTSNPVGAETDPIFVESVALAIVRATGLVPSEGIGKTPTLSIKQADRLRDLIASRLTDHLSLRDMASAVGLSESYFVRAFKGSFGVTPYQYVLRERVALAQSLIKAGHHSLSEIAELSGFPDARRMGRTFRQVTGRSPTGATKVKRGPMH